MMNLSSILLLGAIQAAFLVLLILGKPRKTLPDWILAAWMAMLGAHHTIHVLSHHGALAPSVWLNLNAGVPLLQGPFLYLYVQTLTSGRFRLHLRDLLHLVPFVAFGVYLGGLDANAGQSGATHLSVFRLSTLVTIAILVSVPAYALAALVQLRAHRARTLAHHSETRGRDLSWLRWIVLALLAVWGIVAIAVAVEYIAPGWERSSMRHEMMSAVTLFIYAIGYFGYRQIAVGERDYAVEPSRRSSGEPAKYERSGLKIEETGTLVAQINRYLDEEKPYLREGVTLREVADGLGLPPNHLSQVINQEMNRNFYDLINERRVVEFKRRVVDPGNEAHTLLALALDSGFTSKSSFNRVFKKFTGLSPGQFAAQNPPPDR